MSGRKSEHAIPIGFEKPPLQSGSYEWRYTGPFQCTSSFYEGIRSQNFYPGSFNTKWSFHMEERKCSDGRMLKLLFRVTNAVEVPVELVFTILNRDCTLTLSEKGSKIYEIASFNPEEVYEHFSCYDTKTRKVKVRWIVQDFTGTESLPGALMQDLASLLNNGAFSDCVIVTEDGSHIPVHRSILSTRSLAFCIMLDTGKLKTETRCVKIPDFSTQTVKDMLMFMYTSRLPQFSCERALELLKIAYRYDLEDLKGVCSDSLSLNLTVANVMEVLLLANDYRERSLKRKALNFISKNRTAFTDPSKFHGSVKQRPNLLVEVINRIARS